MLERAGVRLIHLGIHIVDDDPMERRLLGELLSELTTEAQRYLPFLKTLDSSVDSHIHPGVIRHQAELRRQRGWPRLSAN